MPLGVYDHKHLRGKFEEKCHNWKGDKTGYGGMHDWVRKWKGNANNCENCGRTDRKRYEWANIDHQYKRILDDYISLCKSCHLEYDKKFGKVGNNQYLKK